MTNTLLQLPRLKARHRGLECHFSYIGREWTLRRTAEAIGEDSLVQYALYLDGRELDPFALVGREGWERWRQLPYSLPHSRLCPDNVPSARLCELVKSILDAYAVHPDKASCFWPIAA